MGGGGVLSGLKLKYGEVPFLRTKGIKGKAVNALIMIKMLYMVTVGLHPRRIAPMKLKTFL